MQTQGNFEKPDQEEIEQTMKETAAALNLVVSNKLQAAQPKTVPKQPGAPTFIKYTPSQQGPQYASGSRERTIKMQDMPIDPMEPPKFRHKKVCRVEAMAKVAELPEVPSGYCGVRLQVLRYGGVTLHHRTICAGLVPCAALQLSNSMSRALMCASGMHAVCMRVILSISTATSEWGKRRLQSYNFFTRAVSSVL